MHSVAILDRRIVDIPDVRNAPAEVAVGALRTRARGGASIVSHAQRRPGSGVLASLACGILAPWTERCSTSTCDRRRRRSRELIGKLLSSAGPSQKYSTKHARTCHCRRTRRSPFGPDRRSDVGRAHLGWAAPSIYPSVSFRQGQDIVIALRAERNHRLGTLRCSMVSNDALPQESTLLCLLWTQTGTANHAIPLIRRLTRES
jgi:hypothetical protein